MADANRLYLAQSTSDSDRAMAAQLLDSSQKIIKLLNSHLESGRSEFLQPGFGSSAHVLLGRNARSVSTFVFADGSRAVSIDIGVLYELSVLVYCLTRDALFGRWLAPWLLCHNMLSATRGFPSIDQIAFKCFERSPVIFNDILRSCLYLLLFHEIGHEYASQCGCQHALLVSDAPPDTQFRTICLNPPWGPSYDVLANDRGEQSIHVPIAEWVEEFAADVFAMHATLVVVSGGAPAFADFEKLLHHMTAWQFVLFYLYAGNIYRPERESHPSAHNRVDNMVFHMEAIGVRLFGDFRSEAISILHQKYLSLFSPDFMTCHRNIGERAIKLEVFGYMGSEEVLTFVEDGPSLVDCLVRPLLEGVLLDKPLEEWGHSLERISTPLRYGHNYVFHDMAECIKAMNFRFENDE